VPHWRIFSLEDGRQWKLESWLRPGALDEIRKLAEPRLLDALAKRKEGAVFPEERKKAVANFKITPEGLGLGAKGIRISAYYNPNHTLGSVGQGDFNTELGVELPYEKVRNLVKEDSPLARAIT
jgi:hypothetical protein